MHGDYYGTTPITIATQTAVHRMAANKAVRKQYAESKVARAVNRLLRMDSEKDQESMLEVIHEFFYSRKKPRRTDCQQPARDALDSSSEEDSDASDASIYTAVSEDDALQDQGESVK